MIHILNTLARLEHKVDDMAITQRSSPDYLAGMRLSESGTSSSVSSTRSVAIVTPQRKQCRLLTQIMIISTLRFLTKSCSGRISTLIC